MTALLQIDTLAYSKQLKDAGASDALAEVIAVNYPRLDTTELVTHEKLEAEAAKIRQEMAGHHLEVKDEFNAVRSEIAEVRSELKEDIASVRGEIASVRSELKEEIASVRSELKEEITSVRIELKEEIGKTQVLVQSVLTEVKNSQLEMRTAQLMQLRWTLSLGAVMLGALVASVAIL